MRYEAPFLPAASLARAVAALAPDACDADPAPGSPPSRWWVAGPAGLIRPLRRRGLVALPWPLDPERPGAPSDIEGRDVVVLHRVLSRAPDPAETLRAVVRALPGAVRVAVCEPAAWGRAGRWITRVGERLLGRPALGMDPTALGTWCLCAGLVDLRQVWPQGLRSLVLVTGRVHPLAGGQRVPAPPTGRADPTEEAPAA